jgi:hypothetical protein
MIVGMIHLAAEHVWNEMMSLQQLTRACLSDIGGGGSEPTLVVKTKSLNLKYLLKSSGIRFLVGHTKDMNLIYGILMMTTLSPRLGCGHSSSGTMSWKL